jgi:hypothetical protein
MSDIVITMDSPISYEYRLLIEKYAPVALGSKVSIDE